MREKFWVNLNVNTHVFLYAFLLLGWLRTYNKIEGLFNYKESFHVLLKKTSLSAVNRFLIIQNFWNAEGIASWFGFQSIRVPCPAMTLALFVLWKKIIIEVVLWIQHCSRIYPMTTNLSVYLFTCVLILVWDRNVHMFSFWVIFEYHQRPFEYSE